MEYSKQSKLALKAIIKTLAEQQKSIKPQRKTVHFTGVRTMPEWKAAAQHSINRYDLRHLYIAYGFMRGRTIEQIEPNAKTPYNITKVDQILTKHGEIIHADAQ